MVDLWMYMKYYIKHVEIIKSIRNKDKTFNVDETRLWNIAFKIICKLEHKKIIEELIKYRDKENFEINDKNIDNILRVAYNNGSIKSITNIDRYINTQNIISNMLLHKEIYLIFVYKYNNVKRVNI